MDQVDRILQQWRDQRPDLDTGPMGTLGRLKRLADHLTEGLAAVYNAHGLTAAGFDVLATLRRSGPPFALTPSELIAWTMVASGTMTNRLDRLEAGGLIERRPNPQGLALIDEIMAEHVANQHRLTRALSPEQHAQLDAILRAWLGSFQPEAGNPTDRTP